MSESVNIFIFKSSALNRFLTFKFAKNFKNGFETLRSCNSNSEIDPFAENEVFNAGTSLKYSFFGNIEIKSTLQLSTIMLIFPFDLKLFKLPLFPDNSILPFR